MALGKAIRLSKPQILRWTCPFISKQTESGFNLKATRASTVKPATAHRWSVPAEEPGELLMGGGPSHEPPQS